MKAVVAVLSTVILVCATVVASDRGNATRNLPPHLKRAIDATVAVFIEYEDGSTKHGTGFVVADGCILTNAHVVAGHEAGRVSVFNHMLPPTPARVESVKYSIAAKVYSLDEIFRTFAEFMAGHLDMEETRFSWANEDYDMALLRYDSDVRLPALRFETSVDLLESVVIPGYPHVTVDEVGANSAKKYAMTKPTPKTPTTLVPGQVMTVIPGSPGLMYYSAPMQPGNSGSPILNQDGRVVGLNTWSTEGDHGVTWSRGIMAEDIVRFLDASGIRAANKVKAAGTAPFGASLAPTLFDTLSAKYDAGEMSADEDVLAGLLYYLGESGFPRNVEKAAMHFESAMANGTEYGEIPVFALGAIAAIGSPLSNPFYNPRLALVFFRVANSSHALNGEAMQSAYPMTLAYEAHLHMNAERYGLPADLPRAVTLAEACYGLNDNNGLAAAILGFDYYFGHWNSRDHEAAFAMAIRAIEKGCDLGRILLAYIYHRNDYIPTNPERAFALAEDSLPVHPEWAAALLAEMHYSRESDRRDVKKAVELARRGIALGSRYAMFVYGKILSDLAAASDFADKDAFYTAWAFLEAARQSGIGHDADGDTPDLRFLKENVPESNPDLGAVVMRKYQRKLIFQPLAAGRAIRTGEFDFGVLESE